MEWPLHWVGCRSKHIDRTANLSGLKFKFRRGLSNRFISYLFGTRICHTMPTRFCIRQKLRGCRNDNPIVRFCVASLGVQTTESQQIYAKVSQRKYPQHFSHGRGIKCKHTERKLPHPPKPMISSLSFSLFLSMSNYTGKKPRLR